VIPILSEEFFLALGRVTAHFAILEEQVEFLTWSLMGNDQRLGQIVTAEMSFRNKVALLSSVFRHRVDDDSVRDELEQILSRATAVEVQRNVVIHSSWGLGDSPETRTRFKKTARKGKGIEHQFEQMTAAQIESIAHEASAVAMDLSAFAHKLPAELVVRQEFTV